MDLRDALEYLDDQSQSAAKVQTLNAPGKSGRWAIVHRDGKVEWFDQQCGPRKHEVHSFDSFIRATLGMHEADSQTWVFVPQGEPISATVRVNKSDKAHDSIVMPVETTDEFRFLEEDPSCFDQKGLLRVLRVELHRCGVDELVSLLTHVTFSYNDDGDSVIKTGKSSLTRKTVSELASQGEGDQRKELPETVKLNCHYLEEVARVMPRTPTIECLLEVNAGTDSPFSLVPLSGEIETVREDTQDWIVQHLTEAFAGNAGIEVFAGQV